MGETAADTARELDALRGEADRLLSALEGRARRTLDVQAHVEENRPLAMLVGVGAAVVAVGTVLLLWYRSYRRAQEARRPINRLKAGATSLREEAGTRAGRVGRAIRGEPEEVEQAAAQERVKAQETGLPQRVVGAVAAAATLALVDQFTRWLAKQQTTGVEQSTAPAAPPPPPPAPPAPPAAPTMPAAAPPATSEPGGPRNA